MAAALSGMRVRGPAKVRRLPPGPRGHRVLGNLREFAADTLGFATRLAREHGDVARFRLVNREAWLLSSPEAVERVLVENQRNYVKHTFFWRKVAAIFGKGLLTNEGEDWRRQRRLVQPAFHHDRIAEYARVMVDYAIDRVDDWRDGEERDIRHEMTSITFRVVAKTLFDSEVAGDVAEIAAAFDIGIEEIARRIRRPVLVPDWVPTRGNLRYRRAVDRMDRLVYRIIAEHRDGLDRGDLLSALIQARDEDGRPMSEEQLRDETITMLLAGHETTALALTWTWYLVSQHPDVAVRLGEEADGLEGRRPGIADLPRLPFTERVVTESMRLYPPAYSFGREALEEDEIAGYPVPAGTTLFVFPWVLHRDARFYSDPLVFDPDRWTDDFERALPRLAYLPFGAGPRMCIGREFARMELVLIVAAIAQRFRIAWGSEPPVPMASITLRPTSGLMGIVHRR
ncbi:MAG TPA: cytochrome P450 [Gemmatimonadota bacterium]|nr:cytochrome P450 [Gemmatimonadota bacterium]